MIIEICVDAFIVGAVNIKISKWFVAEVSNVEAHRKIQNDKITCVDISLNIVI